MSRLVAFLAAATLVVACSTASAASTRIWLVSESPLRVAGSGFVSGEHVAVTVTVGRRVAARRTVVASSTGRVATRWRLSTGGGCYSTAIVARGSSGSFARWREVVNDCKQPVRP